MPWAFVAWAPIAWAPIARAPIAVRAVRVEGKCSSLRFFIWHFTREVGGCSCRPEAVKRRRRVWRSSAGVNWSSASAASSCSWCVAIACHEERLHLLVLENLYRRSRGALALREREKRLLRLHHHGPR